MTRVMVHQIYTVLLEIRSPQDLPFRLIAIEEHRQRNSYGRCICGGLEIKFE